MGTTRDAPWPGIPGHSFHIEEDAGDSETRPKIHRFLKLCVSSILSRMDSALNLVEAPSSTSRHFTCWTISMQ